MGNELVSLTKEELKKFKRYPYYHTMLYIEKKKIQLILIIA